VIFSVFIYSLAISKPKVKRFELSASLTGILGNLKSNTFSKYQKQQFFIQVKIESVLTNFKISKQQLPTKNIKADLSNGSVVNL
jgi:hypothetical protein